MKQLLDTKTIDAFGLPVRRGRKPTGCAKSAAERQAQHRARKSSEVESLRAHVSTLQQEIDRLKDRVRRDDLIIEANCAANVIRHAEIDRLKVENARLLALIPKKRRAVS